MCIEYQGLLLWLPMVANRVALLLAWEGQVCR